MRDACTSNARVQGVPIEAMEGPIQCENRSLLTVCAVPSPFRCSLAAAPLTVNKKAVADRLVTQQEYDTIVGWLSESLPLESQGRVRQVMLLAKAHAITCAQKLGRGEKTQAFLRCLAAPLPRLWEALNEQEANLAAMETDLLLEEGAR